MAIQISTENPQGLLDEIRAGIRTGRVRNWEIDDDGDITLTEGSHYRRGWLHPTVTSGKLIFGLVGTSNSSVSVETYAEYHSRMSALLLLNFEHDFFLISLTAKYDGVYDKF